MSAVRSGARFLLAANGPMNVAGLLQDVDSQKVVGRMHGLPVVTDPNVPTDGGTGGTEDPVFVMRSCDLVLYETGVRSALGVAFCQKRELTRSRFCASCMGTLRSLFATPSPWCRS